MFLVGASRKDLSLVYEGSDDFGVFPTFTVAPAMRANAGMMSIPGVEFDLSKVEVTLAS